MRKFVRIYCLTFACLETQKIPLDKWEERCIMQTNKGADGDSIERGESQSESSR